VSRLSLIRHGQASFLEANYDKLSPHGEEQARALGAFWVRREVEVHAVYAGPRARQRRSAELVGEVFASAGRSFPEIVELPALDEYRAEEMIVFAMGNLDAHPELAKAMPSMLAATTRRERERAAQGIMRAVMTHWIKEEIALPGIESFASFRARVASALDVMTKDEGRSRNVLAFTSGGTIGAAVASVLRTDDETTLDLCQMSHNAAFTDVLFTGARRSLACFNATPHLAADAVTDH
jgi:broad specificity phosphatase PhoE